MASSLWSSDSPRPGTRALRIGVGGAVGATIRWAATQQWPAGTGWPFAVLAINVAGSAVLGWASGERWRHHEYEGTLRDLVGIGFCGGLTTFSTFAVEVAAFGRAGRWIDGATYTVAAVVLACGAVAAGARAARGSAGVDLPLEGDT